MIKKILLFLFTFFIINNVYAGNEYTMGSFCPDRLLKGFNNGPNNQYFFGFCGFLTTELYNTGGVIKQQTVKYNYQTADHIIYTGDNFIVYRIYHDNTITTSAVGTYVLSASGTATTDNGIFGTTNNSNQGVFIFNNNIYKYGSLTNSYYWNKAGNTWISTGYLNIPSGSYHQSQSIYNIIYSNNGQNIYFNGTNYYLEGIDNNGYYNFQIFNNNILGTILEKINLNSIYKSDVIYGKFYSYTDSYGQQNYYLSNCYSTGKTYTTPEGTFTGQNLTFRGYLDYGSGTPSGFNFIDDKYYKNVYNGNWLKQLSYSGFTNFGYECNPTITYGGFNGNIPTYMMYIRNGVLYKYVFDASEISLFTGNTNIGGASSSASQFLTGSTVPDNTVTDGLFNFDLNGDGNIDIWETALAPFTFIKNVVTNLYDSIKNIWSFLKAILNIGNISIIPYTHADNILQTISNRTSDFTSGNIGDVQGFYNIYNIVEYGTFFLAFFLILILFIYLKFK